MNTITITIEAQLSMFSLARDHFTAGGRSRRKYHVHSVIHYWLQKDTTLQYWRIGYTFEYQPSRAMRMPRYVSSEPFWSDWYKVTDRIGLEREMSYIGVIR